MQSSLVVADVDADVDTDAVTAKTNAAASSSRLDLAIPATGAMLIEFPGYVRNVQAAMQVLGGEQVRVFFGRGRENGIDDKIRKKTNAHHLTPTSFLFFLCRPSPRPPRGEQST